MNASATQPTVKLILGAGAVLAAPLFAGALLAGAVSSAAPAPGATRDASGAGGLSMTPPMLQRSAKVNTAASVIVTNSTSQQMRVTLEPRPWAQALDGTVAPDPHRTLTRLVRPSPSVFTMAANSRRTIQLTLRRHPSEGSLYGGLDLTGVPRGARLPNGITPRYRLIGSLRLDPVRRRSRVQAGTLKVTGRSSRHAIVLPVRNLGNTIEPLTGRVVLTGRGATRANNLRAARIVPRRLVNLTLGTYRGLLRGQSAGRYTLRVTLTQGGRTVLRSTRTVRLT
jgi:hypothetical protein